MELIYQWLMSMTDCKLDRLMDEDTKVVSHIYVNQKDKIYYCICGPHSGNGFTYLVRADAAATHDRWSNCLWEHEFETSEEVVAFFSVGGLQAVYEFVTNQLHAVTTAVGEVIDEIRNN